MNETLMLFLMITWRMSLLVLNRLNGIFSNKKLSIWSLIFRDFLIKFSQKRKREEQIQSKKSRYLL